MNKDYLTKPPVIEISQLSQYFQQGQTRLEILKDVSLKITAGEMVGLVGPSGSGKSTLLHLAGLLERPSGGKIIYMGQDCELMTDHQRTKLRLHEIGFIYQFHHLLKEFTALENVALSSMIIGISKKNSLSKASEILKKFGLTERLHHFPSQLSGGEKQRVAMARALINEPDLIFLDEPTGNLDNLTSKEVINYLNACANEFKSSIIVATHDPEFREFSDKILTMDSGVFV